jgi:hypothetical protein
MWEKATVGARVLIVPENFRFKAIYPHVGNFFCYGAVFQAVGKLLFCIRARLQRLRKNATKVPKGRLNLAQDAILGTIENLIECRRDG